MKTHCLVLTFSLLYAWSAASACDRCGQSCDSCCTEACDNRGILDDTADLFGRLKCKAAPHVKRGKNSLLSMLCSKDKGCDSTPDCGCEISTPDCGCEIATPDCGCEVATPSCGCETPACSSGGCRQPAWDTAPGASCEPLLSRIFKLKDTSRCGSCDTSCDCSAPPAPSCGCETVDASCGCEIATADCGCEMHAGGCACGQGATGHIYSHPQSVQETWHAPPSTTMEPAAPAPAPPTAPVPMVDPRAHQPLPDTQVDPFQDDEIRHIRTIPGKAIHYQSQPRPSYDDAYDHQARRAVHVRIQDGTHTQPATHTSSRSPDSTVPTAPTTRRLRGEVVPASGSGLRRVPGSQATGGGEVIVNPLRP